MPNDFHKNNQDAVIPLPFDGAKGFGDNGRPVILPVLFHSNDDKFLISYFFSINLTEKCQLRRASVD